VKLRVVERFKGVSPEEREITGKIHHNAESVFLVAGERYLLYAYIGRAGPGPPVVSAPSWCKTPALSYVSYAAA
jgi:hypothetical protein